MAILSNPFVLPSTHDARAVRLATQKAVLTGAQYGNNAQVSQASLNIASDITNEYLRRQLVANAGYASLTSAPVIAGNVVSLLAQPVNLGGRLAFLAGASDAALSFDMSGQAAGQYAVIVEWFESVVTPSTTGGTFPPTTLPGVNSSSNKLTSTALYSGGNLDRNSPADGASEAGLRSGTTVQAQRFTQVQYKLRLALDATLVGQTPTTLGSGTYAANPDDSSGLTVRASDPSDYLPSNATPKTSDGYYYAAKLAVIVKAGTTTVYTGETIPGASIIGQAPVLISRNLGALNKTMYDLTAAVAAANANASAVGAALADHIADPTAAHAASAVSTTPPATGFFAGINNAQTAITNLYSFVTSLVQTRPFDIGVVTLGPGGAVSSLVSTNLTLSGQYANRRVAIVVNTFNVIFAGGQVQAQVGINGAGYLPIGAADNSGTSPNDQQRAYGGTQLLQFGAASTIGMNVTVRLLAATSVFDVYLPTQVYISVYTID